MARGLRRAASAVASRLRNGQPTCKCKHGVRWEDPYDWLRDRDSAAVREFLAKENAHALEFLSRTTQELQRELRAEMKSRMEMQLASPPERWGKWLYEVQVPRGKEYPVYSRRKALPKWMSFVQREKNEVLIDMNNIVASNGYAQLGVFKLSPDHNLLAYTIDVNGAEEFTLFVKDMRTGELLARIGRVVSVEWSKAGRSLYYTTADELRRPYRVLLHRLHSEKDEVIFEDSDPRHFVDVTRTKDWRYILINVNSKVSSEVFLVDSFNCSPCLRRVQERILGIQYFVEHHQGHLYILTNSSQSGKPDSSNDYRLVRCRVEGAKLSMENWKQILPADDSCWIEDMDIVKNWLVLYMRESGLPVVQVLDISKLAEEKARNDSLWRLSLPPSTAAVSAGANSDFTSSTLRLSASSPVMPERTYDVDLATGELSLLQIVQVPGVQIDEQSGAIEGYSMEHRTATSHDGVQVPLTIVYSKSLERRATNPALLLGYGAYGELLDMSFSSDRLSLLDRGWVLAFAHVRGGGTLGKSWHDAGKLLKKKNSFEDFIACARFLVQERYASSAKLAAWGESAGGLLVAAAVNMQPELFKAIVLKVPFLDVLNTMLDSSLSLTKHEYDEWGNPSADEEVFHYIRGYSPYDNVKPGVVYPSMLVSASLEDTRVGFWEAAKYVSAVRHLTKADPNRLILLKTGDFGHFGDSGRYEHLKQVACDYAFLIHAMENSEEDK